MDNAGLARANDESCIVRRLILIEEKKFIPHQQDAPDDLDLIIGKGEADAAMLPAAESDQPVGGKTVFFPRRCKAGGIAAAGIGERLPGGAAVCWP